MATDPQDIFVNRRLVLHAKLVELLGSDNVYYQPPESIRLQYPCIVYDLSGGDSKYADNIWYMLGRRFTVTHIHRDPDVDIMDSMGSEFIYSRFDRRFVSDNLYHDVYTLYYK